MFNAVYVISWER